MTATLEVLMAQARAAGRQILKDNLALCTLGQQLVFKRMYSHGHLERAIDDIVDALPDDRLGWAMKQVQNTVDKRV